MIENEKPFSCIRSMPYSSIFFILFFLLKPFYLFQSGSIQPGDLFLLLSFTAYLFEGKSVLPKKDKLFFCFLIFVIIINGIYFVVYWHFQFIMSCLYYLFNFFVVIVFRDSMNNRAFQKSLSNVCKINLVIQLLLFISHTGSYWEGTFRYMGSYNDPNQLGFAIISTLCILRILNQKHWYFYAFISLYLIMKTYSGGMLVSLALLVACDIIINLDSKLHQKYRKSQIIALLFVFFGGGIYIIMNSQNSSLDFGGFRIEEKLSSSSSIIDSFISDRNLRIAVEHPEFFLWGYGEAVNFRRYGHGSEMHSTWLSLWFCYGIIPFFILIRWIYNNIRNIDVKYMAVFIAIFLEAFTLVNHRQPSFWMIILLGNLCKRENCKNEEGLNIEINEI